MGLLLWLAFLWVALVQVRDNPFGAVAVALLASPILLFVLRVFLEDWQPKGLFDPATQSWAFLFGDALWLPMAFAAAAYGQRSVPQDSTFRSGWWLAVSVVAGVAAGVVFHKMDQAVYVTAGYGQALLSPTKLAHDFVAYPLLFGGLQFLGVPVLVHHFWWTGMVALAGVLLWGAMGVHDMVKPLNPAHLHPKWSTQDFSVRR